MLASQEGHSDVVKVLLDKGAHSTGYISERGEIERIGTVQTMVKGHSIGRSADGVVHNTVDAEILILVSDKGQYEIKFMKDCEFKLPAKDMGKDYIAWDNGSAIYTVRGYISKNTTDTGLPILNAIYISKN
jgi:hypothetical protein